MENLDQNIITWAVVSTFTAKTSKFKTALKKGLFGKVSGGSFFSHFANKEKAEQAVELLKNKGTNFSVIYITDKQFGEMKINYSK